ADGPLARLPADHVLVHAHEDLCGGGVLAVVADAGRLDDPALAVAGPEAFAVTSLGVEYPRLELPGHGVPADPLRSGHRGLALKVHGERADQEVLVVGPVA